MPPAIAPVLLDFAGEDVDDAVEEGTLDVPLAPALGDVHSSML
jgi:hypothetical protein